MAEEPFAQRIERLVQERNVPALLAETQQLLTIYLAGDDNLDLEPIVSALSILQRIAGLQRTMPMPADRQTLAGRRFRVTEVVVYEFPAVDEEAALQQLIADPTRDRWVVAVTDRYVEPVDMAEFPGLEL